MGPTGQVVRRSASSMAGANGASEPGAETPQGDAAAPAETAPRKPRRTRAAAPAPEAPPSDTGPASPTSAAAKGRKARGPNKAKVKPPSTEDFMLVGEVTHIAFGAGGKDAVEPKELIAVWRERIAAWDRIHGGQG